MAKLVPTVSVVLIRDDNRVHPEIGKKFDFTAEEAKSINESHPGALRKPSDEDDGNTIVEGGSNAETAQAGAKGGKKASTANKTAGAESTDGEGGGEGAGSDDDL